MLSSSLGLNRFDIKKQLGQGSFSKRYIATEVTVPSVAHLEHE